MPLALSHFCSTPHYSFVVSHFAKWMAIPDGDILCFLATKCSHILSRNHVTMTKPYFKLWWPANHKPAFLSLRTRLATRFLNLCTHLNCISAAVVLVFLDFSTVPCNLFHATCSARLLPNHARVWLITIFVVFPKPPTILILFLSQNMLFSSVCKGW